MALQSLVCLVCARVFGERGLRRVGSGFKKGVTNLGLCATNRRWTEVRQGLGSESDATREEDGDDRRGPFVSSSTVAHSGGAPSMSRVEQKLGRAALGCRPAATGGLEDEGRSD